MAVLARVVDEGLGTVIEDQAAGALDLQEEHVHGVRGPGQFQPAPGQQLLLFYLAAGVVAALVAALVLLHVRRQGVDGLLIAGLAGTAGPDAGLIVAGIGDAGGDFHPLEILEEELRFGIQTGQQRLQAQQGAFHVAPGQAQAGAVDGHGPGGLALDIAQGFPHRRRHLAP